MIKAMKQALEALEEIVKWYGVRNKNDVMMPPLNQNPEIKESMDAITALRTAIEQAEKQEQGEPVAWLYPEGLEALQRGKCWTAYGTKQDDDCNIPVYLNAAVAPKVEPAKAECGGFDSHPAAPVQEIDWKDMYEKEKRRSEMWIAKYEKDIGPLEKAGPVAAQQEAKDEPVAFKIYKPTPPRHAIPNVRDAELPWVYDQDPSSGNVASMWVTPVKATPPAAQPNQVTLTQTNIGIGERGMEAYEAAKKRGWVGLSDERLMEMPKQEPVAKIVPCYTPSGKRVALYTEYQHLPIGTDLYTTPPTPQRQLVWLDWLPEHKCGLHLSHNEHRDVYETVEQFYDVDDFISEEEWHKAVAEDSVWVLHWYPNTPVGFTRIAASTLEAIEAKLRSKNT